MWTFEYNPETDDTTVKWREYDEVFEGEITREVGGFPDHGGANEAVNSILESINSIPVGLEAVAEFRPGMIEYVNPENDTS